MACRKPFVSGGYHKHPLALGTLAFHYHIPVAPGPPPRLPGYLGVFLDALAAHVDRLELLLHQAPEVAPDADYALQATNIVLRLLGPKRSVPHRHAHRVDYWRLVTTWADAWDAMLLRAPTPLADPIARAAMAAGAPLALLVVGDHRDSIPNLRMPPLRRLAVAGWCHWNMRELESLAREAATVLVNNPHDIRHYRPLNPSTHEVRTTTLRGSDIDGTEAKQRSGPFRILYVGRLAADKGVDQLLSTLAHLRGAHRRQSFDLELAGAWDNPRFRQAMEPRCSELGVKWHGYVPGTGLKALYRAADVFVISSPHNEGFPRAIWEAMAVGTPVVSTRVGGIGHVLRDGHDALLVAPRDPQAMATAIARVCEDATLRATLVRNGLERARENTIERRVPELLSFIEADVAPARAPRHA